MFRNFAAQVARDLPLSIEVLRKKRYSQSASFYEFLLNAINTAQHFALPDGCRLFNDELRGIEGEILHLPYPAITIECVDNETPPSEGKVHVPRRLAVAVEDAALATKMLKEVPAHAIDGTAVIPSDICVFGCSKSSELGLWHPDPFGVVVFNMPNWGRHSGRVPMKLFPTCHEFLSAMVQKYGSAKALYDQVQDDLALECRATLELIEALSCSNVTTQRTQQTSQTVNEKRTRNGKAPLLDYHVLVLDNREHQGGSRPALADHRAPPRQHLRRGHIRRYTDGHKVWINSMLVGDAGRGVVHKSYDTKAPAT